MHSLNRFYWLASSLVLFAGAASAGAADLGYGSTAVVCRGAGGSVASAEVLDLYEAREIYNISVISVSDVTRARQDLLIDLARTYNGKSLYPRYLQDTIGDFHGRFRKSDTRLKLVADVYPRIPSCAIEQVSALQKNGEILLDAEIFSALTPIGRLAVELHDSVAFLDRKFTDAKDSRFARKLTGLLLGRKWGKSLDVAIALYSFSVPRPGRYSGGFGRCIVRIDSGTAGSLRVTPQTGCRTVISWDAFENANSAILRPTGKTDEWAWQDRSGAKLVLKRTGSTTFTLDDVEFKLGTN
ncbi:MAG: hypothetical protein JST04_17575 [Bdellovibrionales bacterium]|nr:hypothetical protein [Bdellovibrionales bacterium]